MPRAAAAGPRQAAAIAAVGAGSRRAVSPFRPPGRCQARGLADRRAAAHLRIRGGGGARPRRDGRRLPGVASAAQPPRRPEDAPGGAFARPAGAGAVPARGARRWRPCGIRTSCRSTTFGDLDGLPYFTMELVKGGSLALKLAGTPLPTREAAGAARHAGRGRPGRAPGRDRPPRPEAGERAAHRRRHAQDRRLRARPAAGRRCRCDPDRHRAGDAELHGPRAGPGRAGCGRAAPWISMPWGRSSTSC